MADRVGKGAVGGGARAGGRELAQEREREGEISLEAIIS